MIADALRVEVEIFAKTRMRENILFKMTEAGQVDASCMRTYWTNLHFLLRETYRCLKHAHRSARAKGDVALADFYQQKLEEEVGHWQWAEEDMANLPATAPSDTGVLPSMRRYVAFTMRTIDDNPTLYLAYMLFAEHFTVVLCPEWMDLLEKRCGLPRSAMTVIDKHVALDVGHVEEALATIDDLVDDPAMVPRMREVLQSSMDHYFDFCTEFAHIHERQSGPLLVADATSSAA